MRRRQMLKLLGGGAAGLWLPGAAARACGLHPAQAAWRFDVLRHGDVIGDHVFTFRQGGGDFVVEVAIDIAVGLLGVTLFRFTHQAEEVWRDGRLQALASDTDDDGTPWRVRYARDGGRLRGAVNGTPAEAPGDILPASLWHRDTVAARRLLDTVDGAVKPVTPEVLGPDHFRLAGGMQREVWTGGDCSLTKVVFPARDGSLIALERR